MSNIVLEIGSLSKSFNGHTVIGNVSFSVPQGELSAIIGPNGAGKTTLFNLITGNLVPNSGGIFFQEKEISGLQPFDIVRRGIARAFQVTNIFPRLSVLENVVATVITYRRGNLNLVTPTRKLGSVYEKAHEVLEKVGLAEMATGKVAPWPTGARKYWILQWRWLWNPNSCSWMSPPQE